MKGTILMLEKGHVFVYGTSGVCRVEDICVRDYGTGKKEYYILQPVFDLRSNLSIPIDSPALSAHSRELLSESEILGIMDSLRENETEWIKNDKERIETFRKILETGTFGEVFVLLKAIRFHKKELLEKGKKLRSSDEALMQRAEKLLFGEIAWVLGIEPKAVPEYINERIK